MEICESLLHIWAYACYTVSNVFRTHEKYKNETSFFMFKFDSFDGD